MSDSIIVAEIVIDLPNNKMAWVEEWIERFRFDKYRNHPRIHGAFGEVLTHERAARRNWHDTIPNDGHVEFTILLPFNGEKGKLRVRGVQRPTYQRQEDEPTVLEYMTLLQHNSPGLIDFLGMAAKAEAEAQRRRSA